MLLIVKTKEFIKNWVKRENAPGSLNTKTIHLIVGMPQLTLQAVMIKLKTDNKCVLMTKIHKKVQKELLS